MSLTRRAPIAGFTLVELIVVIILVAIISVYAASRYIGVTSFSALAAQEQGIAVIRQIQLGRMQSNLSDPGALQQRYRLQVSDACLGSAEACRSSEPDRHSSAVIIEDQQLSFSPSMAINFDLLGNPGCNSGCTTPVDGGNPIRILISSDTEQQGICINSQGYVYGC